MPTMGCAAGCSICSSSMGPPLGFNDADRRSRLRGSIPELDGNGFGLLPDLESRVLEPGRPRRVARGGEPIEFGWLTGGIGVELAVVIRIMEGADGILAGWEIPDRVADVSLRRPDPKRRKGFGTIQKALLAVENRREDVAPVVRHALDRDHEVRCSGCAERGSIQDDGNEN